MDTGNKNLILAKFLKNSVDEIEERIKNIDSQIDLIKNNKNAVANWNGQKVAYKETINILNDIFMKNITN